MELRIISPKGVVCNATVDRVSLPGEAGRFTVLKDHAPIISTLNAGTIEFGENGAEHTCKSNANNFVARKHADKVS